MAQLRFVTESTSTRIRTLLDALNVILVRVRLIRTSSTRIRTPILKTLFETPTMVANKDSHLSTSRALGCNFGIPNADVNEDDPRWRGSHLRPSPRICPSGILMECGWESWRHRELEQQRRILAIAKEVASVMRFASKEQKSGNEPQSGRGGGHGLIGEKTWSTN